MSPVKTSAFGLAEPISDGDRHGDELLIAGADYIERLGWPIGTTYGADTYGRCACPGGCRTDAYKHPVGGFDRWTRNAEQFAAWVGERQFNCGVFLRLGAVALVDLDLDVRESGRWEGELAALEAELGALPAPLAAFTTPTGGEHRIYPAPPSVDGLKNVHIAKHVELRASGGLVLPPTRSYYGGCRRWTVAP